MSSITLFALFAFLFEPRHWRKTLIILLRCQPFHRFRIFSKTCCRVAAGAMVQRLLCRLEILRHSFPGLDGRRLQCAAKGETQLPRGLSKPVQRIEMLRRADVALAA